MRALPGEDVGFMVLLCGEGDGSMRAISAPREEWCAGAIGAISALYGERRAGAICAVIAP